MSIMLVNRGQYFQSNDVVYIDNLLPIGSIITKYMIEFSSSVTIYSYDAFNFTIYNDQDVVATLQSPHMANAVVSSENIDQSHGGISNSSAFQSNTAFKMIAQSKGALNSITYKVRIEYTAPTLTWSNPTLSLSQSQSDLQVTATMGGTATHSAGLAVTYYLYEGSTLIGEFNNGTLTFTPSVGSHTYKTVASAGGLTTDGATTSITVVERDNCTVGYYDGTNFIECEVYRYDGMNFVQMKPYYYDGNGWIEIQQ